MKHLKKDRNIAELALGTEFKNLKTGEKPPTTMANSKPKGSVVLKPIDPNEPLSYSN